jgi:N-acetylmuramoyl-L-alanine amidase
MKIIQSNFNYRNPLTPLVLSNIKYIVVHHAEAINATPEDIHKWHLDNGWAGFGYNEYIRKDGTVYIGRGDNVGAQCYGYNSVSYGICAEGNYDIELSMPKELFDSLVERLKFHKNRFTNVKIVGHRDLFNTDCPGKNFPFEQVISAPAKPTEQPHWAKKDNDELVAAGILSNDHTLTLDKPATEGMVIVLVNKIRKEGKQA